MGDATDQPAAPTAADRHGRARLGPVLDRAAWLILPAVLAALSLTVPGYAETGTLAAILEHASVVGLLAIGLSLVVIAGQIDLSIESVLGLSAMTTALLFGGGGVGLGWTLDPPWLVLPVTLAGAVGLGCAAGLVNAALVVRLRLNAFIATLAAYGVLRGAVVATSGGHMATGLPPELHAVVTVTLLGVPGPAWILVAAFLAFGAILARTPFGRQLYAIGGNPKAPIRAAIDAGRTLTVAFVLSGGLAALAGWLLAARFSGATANLGIGLLFETFAAVVIGGVSLKGGTGRLSDVLAGALLLSAIAVLGLPAPYALAVQCALVLTAVLLDRLKTSIRRGF